MTGYYLFFGLVLVSFLVTISPDPLLATSVASAAWSLGVWSAVAANPPDSRKKTRLRNTPPR